MQIQKDQFGQHEALVNSSEFDDFISRLWQKVDYRVYYTPITKAYIYIAEKPETDHAAMTNPFSAGRDGADYVLMEWVAPKLGKMASMEIYGRRADYRRNGATVRGFYKIHAAGVRWLRENPLPGTPEVVKEKPEEKLVEEFLESQL